MRMNCNCLGSKEDKLLCKANTPVRLAKQYINKKSKTNSL